MSDPIFLRPLTAPDADRGEAVEFGPDKALELDSGRTLKTWTLAYKTYGKLNAARSNTTTSGGKSSPMPSVPPACKSMTASATFS